ncbi:MAG: YheC/YheD family protein, partial [Alicyclobacillus sp.]|nr:YheC/YheD family protein [Alicyclobacillus sp.]
MTVVGASRLLIGVVTTVRPRCHQGKPCRPPWFYRRMAERAAGLGAELAVLAPEDVRWPENRMRAWVPLQPEQPDGVWKQRWLRLPDVFYENVFVHLAVRGVTGPLRRAAAARVIPLFNPLMGHKWTMHTWLQRAGLGAYLPETHPMRDLDQAIQLICTWGTAYIKPAGGYGGAGVTRVEALP